MAVAKSYARDHFVLLLLTANIFGAVLTTILVLLRYSSVHSSSYFVQYRSSLGVNAFKTGSGSEIISFAVFALLILAINVGLSIKTYPIQRHLAVAVLSLGLLLTLLDLIVSNALLALH